MSWQAALVAVAEEEDGARPTMPCADWLPQRRMQPGRPRMPEVLAAEEGQAVRVKFWRLTWRSFLRMSLAEP